MTWYVDVYVDEYDIQWSRPDPIHKVDSRIKETIIEEFLDYLKKPKFQGKGHEGESRNQYLKRLNRWENAMRYHIKLRFNRQRTRMDKRPIKRLPKMERITYSWGTGIRYRDPVTGRFVRK